MTQADRWREMSASNYFKGNVGKSSERRGWAQMCFSERIDTTLNWTEQNWTTVSVMATIYKHSA